ncbi:hypothetical protein [Acinetobacter sp. TUM15099]|uniref:hypothetical protein n=1 Tax=Acinetobacter sp. TUM15099 TaxID=2609136 RepID=UPI00124E0137|nr:hypothetical protein [Acinetobacter sp. TUM15099]
MFIEIIKIATPYILALIVYLVWHVQKEKEVISSEARNLLNLLNNYNNESRRFEKEVERTYRKETLEEKSSSVSFLDDELNKLFDLHEEIFNSIDFISSSVLDVDLFDHTRNYLDAVIKILEQYSKCRSHEKYFEIKDNLKKDRKVILEETYKLKKVILTHVLFRKKYFLSLLRRSF